MTQVLNRSNLEDFDDFVYIGRPSVFGNPWRVEREFERPKAVRFYFWYFYARLDMDPDFRRAVEGLRGKVLACWCAPRPCHGDVIARYLDYGTATLEYVTQDCLNKEFRLTPNDLLW